MNTKTKTTQRKRGRPAGKDRVPLSLEERRARNSQYERERRIEHAQAVAELVEASGFDSGLPFHNLLRLVCCYLKMESRRGAEESVDSLRQVNNNLVQRIKQAKASLAAHTPPLLPNDEEHCSMRTRPFMYMRNLKKERILFEKSENTNKSIKTEVDINVSPTQTVQPAFKRMKTRTQRAEPTAYATVKIKTEVDAETIPDIIHDRKLHERTQITEPITACATVKIKTEVDSETMPDIIHERKLDKRTQITEPITACATVKIKTEADTKNMADSKYERIPHHDTESRSLAKTDKELKPQETQWWPQEIPLQADPLILGLFTEAEAKHDIVQYYINLLKKEGYYGRATAGRYQ